MALCQQHIFIVLTKRPERMAEYLNNRDTYARVRAIVDGPSNVRAAWFKTLDIYQREQAQKQWWTDLRKENWPLPNVWLGTSVEDQTTANARIPHLLKCPAAVRFLSCEPLLGPVDLTDIVEENQHTEGHFNVLQMERDDAQDERFGTSCVDWAIAGGESGPRARPMHPDWARSLRDQCKEAGVPFFFKQWGALLPECQAAHLLPDDGARWFRTPSPHNPDKVNKYLRYGKKAAGRLLDGVEHNEFPKR